MSLHFFISRAGEDSKDAIWVADLLKAEGHDTTLQDYDFRSGSFPEHISRALAECDRFIAVLSPYYLEKQFTLAELHAAYARDPLHLILPVHVAPCKNPDLIKHLIYLDFVGKDDAQRRQALLNAVGPARTEPEIRTSIQKLPTVDPHLFGRDAQLEWLERAWRNPQANFVQVIAPGGAGKTALMTRWYRRHLGDVTVFGWSFYSQGTGEKSQTSSDPFFAEALRWFGINVPATESIWAKVDLLAERLRRERVLLILDGIEPLQDPSGSLRDLALKALLQELAARNAGMVLATTRVRLIDLPDALAGEAPHSVSLELENLDPADGARYLAHLGVLGTEDELRAASVAYESHALALTLLGTYLVTFCDADIRRRTDIRELSVEDTKAGRHARKVMASYARMYAGEPELDILRGLGYFDRPAEPEALRLVMPAIEDRKYRAALRRLKDTRLILTTDPAQPIDCHPLVREHFSTEATREGHARLYEHYKTQAPELPDTLEEMTPLFYAVYHGCQAGQHQAALEDLYIDRIHRGDDFTLTAGLGAFGTDLSLLANFFNTRWLLPVATLSAGSQSWVIGQSGYTLSALGRFADAVEPLGAATESYARSKEWNYAAKRCGTLSVVKSRLGSLPEAVAAARRSSAYADCSGNWLQRLKSRTNLALALHLSGDFGEAMRCFAEAEQIQAQGEPQYPFLYGVPGDRYCDLLLDQGLTAEVLRRAVYAQPIAGRSGRLVDIGLGYLSLGRAYPAGSAEAAHHLDQAVDCLRRAGQLDLLPRALLARGTPRDLDEVFRIATRSGMKLFLADYHLAMGNLAEAEALINETGYHRRDGELAALRARKAKG